MSVQQPNKYIHKEGINSRAYKTIFYKIGSYSTIAVHPSVERPIKKNSIAFWVFLYLICNYCKSSVTDSWMNRTIRIILSMMLEERTSYKCSKKGLRANDRAIFVSNYLRALVVDHNDSTLKKCDPWLLALWGFYEISIKSRHSGAL